MPGKPPRPCRAPMCSGKTTERQGYCEEHVHLATGWQRTQQGKNSTERGYGGHWRKLRRVVMQRDGGLCQPCRQAGRITSASAVDHIVPKGEGGTDSHDNLQAICSPCHKAKTQQEATRARQGDT
ncbi:HNH endonuclease [Halomonas lysinitropha]|nr:HNH endonuclease [Halomonas lysinitropha]